MENQPLKRKRNKLFLLPPVCMKRADDLILVGFSDKYLKTTLLKEFPEHADVLNVSRNTFRDFIALRRLELSHPSTSQPAIPETPTPPPLPVSQKSFLGRLREKLEAQCSDIENQLTALKDRQKVGDTDPDLEEQINRLEKSLRETIRLLMEFDDESDESVIQNQLKVFKPEIIQNLMLACREAYLKKHGDQEWEEFKDDLNSAVAEKMRNFQNTFNLGKG